MIISMRRVRLQQEHLKLQKKNSSSSHDDHLDRFQKLRNDVGSSRLCRMEEVFIVVISLLLFCICTNDIQNDNHNNKSLKHHFQQQQQFISSPNHMFATAFTVVRQNEIRIVQIHQHPKTTTTTTTKKTFADSIYQTSRTNNYNNRDSMDRKRMLLFATKSASDQQQQRRGRRSPSVVVDPAGPTPLLDSPNIFADEDGNEILDIESVPELREIQRSSELPTPIPYQPWRRGELDGCDDPIDSVWRQRGEELMKKAVQLVGGHVIDVTWYLTCVVISIDENQLPDRNILKSRGPVINIIEPNNPMYYDPTDPEPEEIWDDEDDIMFMKETEEEEYETQLRKKKMYATKDMDLDDSNEPDQPNQAGIGDTIPLFRNIETRDEIALKVLEDEQERYDENEQPILLESALQTDTAAISTIAQAILDSLETEEDTLRILQRHEVIISGRTPGSMSSDDDENNNDNRDYFANMDLIETQQQFNKCRDQFVIVQTIDPFESNRILKGTLIDRNAMDLIINKKGRMVTIPLNFVQYVRLAPTSTDNNNDNPPRSTRKASSTRKSKKSKKESAVEDDIDEEEDDEEYEYEEDDDDE